ncbi:hypothetical protein LTR37_004812 [Vermiconidia calcicola]|uniref:Uncharacterized protein n=1 Tax=Vermiconidia calcicola TaxID=1690605 RepID=A0ACC3NL16_9PEZI|nr:hypothetical protein LTR37_004812 [Vermiconidia calcicola]
MAFVTLGSYNRNLHLLHAPHHRQRHHKMRSRSQSTQSHIIKEIDVLSAPMAIDHKLLVLRHFRRLRNIIDEDDEDRLSRYTSKQAAREQLARMTLVFRDYMAMHARGEIGDEVESMVADVVDASFFVVGREHTFEQPTFANPLLLGREQEIVALMQELRAGNVDDVVELWNIQPTTEAKVVPDTSSGGEDIGRELDWTRVLCRSSSEDNVLFHRGGNVVVKDRPEWQRSLSKRNLSALDKAWPPASMAVRPRSGTDISDWD